MQKILCDKGENAHLNSCHLLEGTICHLLKHCGDPFNRFVDCDYNYDVGVAMPDLNKWLWNNRYMTVPVGLIVFLCFAVAILPDIA